MSHDPVKMADDFAAASDNRDLDAREQQIRSVIEEGWAAWFSGYSGSMDVMACRLAYEAGWRQQEASFKALLADQDRAIEALAAAREESGRHRAALEQVKFFAGRLPRHVREQVEAALAREDGEPTTAREDELVNLRGLLLQAGTALLSAMYGGPVDDTVLNDIEAALPQGLAREDGHGSALVLESIDPAEVERLKALWNLRCTGDPDFDFREAADADR